MDVTKAVYLGDGLYAEYDGWTVVLYASDGARRSNAVYLEPSVLTSFLTYVFELRKAMEEKRPCVSAEPPQIVVVPWKAEKDG